jgi:hypothetical protein
MAPGRPVGHSPDDANRGGAAIEFTVLNSPSDQWEPVQDIEAHRAAVEAWLASVDELATRIALHWPDGVSAVDAVREQRREL